MRDFFKPNRSVVYSGQAAAATSHPVATLTAIDVLRAGGNAVDAAVAAVAVQCVVDPLMTGIGGDCFVLYAPRGAQAPIALNGSGQAPASAEPSYFLERGLEAIGLDSVHSVTIPGAIAAWSRLAQDYGTRSLGELLQPAIRAAEEGYRVQPRVACDWAKHAGRLLVDPDSTSIFLRNGRPPREGDLHRQPKLGATLRKVAEGGRDAFYTGPVAEDAVRKLRSMGGLHTLQDFAEAGAEYVTPISTRYRGYDVFECPPSGQGLAALMMLNALSGYDLSEGNLNEIDRIHLFAEICKQVYSHRDQLIGDPRYVDTPIEELLSDQWSDRARSNVDMARAAEPASWPKVAHQDTVYLCVVDGDGNAISLINSLFYQFGSGICAGDSGFLFQNRGAQFRLDPGHPNAIAGRKRPLHTIIPGMLMRNGRTVAPFGVLGGHYQAMGHAQLLTNILDRGMDLQEAIEAPRSFAYEGRLDLETTYPRQVKEELTRRGHDARWLDEPLGGAQIIWIDNERGVLASASEPRKDGMAIGI